MQLMPSSPNRRRVEIPAYVFDRVQKIAEREQRTVASVVQEILLPGVWNYQAKWLPSDREKLNRHAARVLDLAEGEVPGQFNHNYVGTEHLLLAMLDESEGAAAHLLRGLGVDRDAVSGHIASIIGLGDQPVQGKPEWAPRVRQVMALALREARNLDHNLVGTAHLLRAIGLEGQGIAAGILQRLGAFPQQVAQEALRVLESGETPLTDV